MYYRTSTGKVDKLGFRVGVDVGHGWSMLVRDVKLWSFGMFDGCSSTNGDSSASKTWCFELDLSMRGVVHMRSTATLVYPEIRQTDGQERNRQFARSCSMLPRTF
jgi:hypothetical protein